tara:strand:+ start:3641 stop:4870 length:1230 start_codon:yes stop_codon:yes gene_type:complete
MAKDAQNVDVDVKQEGDFKIKSQPKKPKQLVARDKEVAKIDFTKPEAQGDVVPEVVKVDLNKTQEDAVQTPETNVGDVVVEKQEDTPDSKGVAKEVRETEQKVDTPITEIIEEVKEEPLQQPDNVVVDETSPQPVLPENVDKLVKFMDETGGTVEDYVKLNRDYSKLEDDSLLKEYYAQTKPHLSQEEISFLIDDKFMIDEDIDEDKDIRRKKLAYKEEVANAKKDLEEIKSKYYAEIKHRPGTTAEQQKALEFFNRYNKQQEVAKSAQADFKQKTNQLFSEEFKGFDYTVGEKQFRYKVQDPKSTAQKQNDINNFISTFLDKDGKVTDAAGYHKALYAAMNADKLAQHFYEQGKADGVKNIIKQSKNPATESPRQVASGDVFVGGIKVKSISGSDSSKLKIRKRTFNN